MLRCNNLQLFSGGGGRQTLRNVGYFSRWFCARYVLRGKRRGAGWGVRWAHGGQRVASIYKTPRSQAGLCVNTGRQASRRSDRGVLHVFWLPQRILSKTSGPAQALSSVPGCFVADSTVTVLSSAVFGEPASGLARSGEHLEHLLGGDHHQSEGEVGGDLGRAAHADMPSAVLLVQMGVDAFDPAALPIAHGLGG